MSHDISDENALRWKRMIEFARAGRVQEAERLIAEGVDVGECEYEQGCSALHTAASCGHADFVRLMLRHGAKVNGIFADARTPLHDAAASGSVETFRLLSDAGASVLATDEDRRLPVHYAAMSGSVPMLQEIAARGGLRHVGASIEGDGTPLSCAVARGHREAALFLVANGADVHDTLLYVSDHRKVERPVEQLRFLLDELQADPEKDHVEGWRPAFAAAVGGKGELLAALLEHPATSQDTLNVSLALVLRHDFPQLAHIPLGFGADRRIPEVISGLRPQIIFCDIATLRRRMNAELVASGIEAAMPAESIETAAPSRGFTL